MRPLIAQPCSKDGSIQSEGYLRAGLVLSHLHGSDAKRARVEVEAHSSFKRLQAETFSSRQAERNLLKGRKVNIVYPSTGTIARRPGLGI